ncbi:hypothetical protein BJQ97_01237 [Geobacillus sp. TFV-3]|nr:hypothetical protein BJQ97_01237 [Geobacillus sp. TFV-3]
MVNQAIHQRSCQAVVPKHPIPLSKFQIRRHDDAFSHITVGDNMKQQLRSLLLKRHIAEFIQYQQFARIDASFQPPERAIFQCLFQLGDEIRNAEKPNLMALLARLDAERCGEMGFSCPGRA